MKAQSLVDLCKKALSIDSSTNTGTTDFVSHIESLSEGLGLFFQKRNYLFRDLDYQNILISASSDPQDVQLLFVNPLDTESPGSFRSWTETDMDPFFYYNKRRANVWFRSKFRKAQHNFASQGVV